MDSGLQTLRHTTVAVSYEAHRLSNTFTPSPPVNCETPEQPVNGSVSVEGQAPHPLRSMVTYHCDDGFLPTAVMTSTCTDVGGRGEWVPNPAQLMCRAPGRSNESLYTQVSSRPFHIMPPPPPPFFLHNAQKNNWCL